MNDALGNNIAAQSYDDSGRQNYTVITDDKGKDVKATIYKTPDRVIPVIFLPGVMGSNLMDQSGKPIWRLDSLAGTAWDWVSVGAKKRKDLLSPERTFVDSGGKIEPEYESEVKQFGTRRDRGWGEVGYVSYGQFLPWLQGALNDHDLMEKNKKNNNGHLTLREQLQNKNLNAEIGEENLTKDDIELSYKYLFPVHVVGYNWLQSNEKSATVLKERVNSIVSGYSAQNMLCEKVIIITHSMGGFVARHYSENAAGKDNILGIVHGVMPTLGSPMTYKRMKAGEAGNVGRVIGSSGSEMTAVLAQSPGPLQLLPGISYGLGWLQIEGVSGGLPKSDPFKEIYSQRTPWWALCEDRLINPNNKKASDSDWNNYIQLLIQDVKSFIEKLDGKFHKNTYAFYGNDGEKYPSYETLYWKDKAGGYYDKNKDISEIAYSGVIKDPYNYEIKNYRTAKMQIGLEKNIWREKTYIIAPPKDAGDGTVPIKGAKFVNDGLHGMLGVGVDHEGAFKNTDTENSRLFTLRSIIKISQDVSKTTLAYNK
ncbi:PGAP1-like protein [Yersinia frederiksenii]|uniref:PGAP1-like protein n=2 Tax=Yersinia frederiksenii TaxID=29484 RepID=A0A380PTX2_YERFR|nr:hypothetical protein [Yersinia frederiksenii]ATM94510.1 hypothetical protein CRN75_03285 [Yersinia frederiksenii]EEQ13329.1 hypothetical protein yfred0001_31560 [Yersinia frederiksenii ATCC 33641]KGA48912.1 PGAP1-like family protein [Yersinia frederiksenii ATCC 33641]SUP76988.1 PGAP1-like protein [Yersinia frederiksenii]